MSDWYNNQILFLISPIFMKVSVGIELKTTQVFSILV